MKGLEYALSNLQGTCTSNTRAKYRGQKKGKQIGLFLTSAASRSEEKQSFYVPYIGLSTKSRSCSSPRFNVTDLVMKCVWYLWRILDTLGTTKERTWKFNSLRFGGGIKFHRTTGWKQRCVIWRKAWIREDCSLRCADAACYCLKGTLCHVVIVSHCPLCWWHCRDWHQAERFGEYNIHVASICYPRPWPGLSHGAMFECSRGCDRVVFADSLEKLKSKVGRGRG